MNIPGANSLSRYAKSAVKSIVPGAALAGLAQDFVQGGGGGRVLNSAIDLVAGSGSQPQGVPTGGQGASTGTTSAPASTAGSGYNSNAATTAAQNAARANALRGNITNLVRNITGVYDALYGDLNTAATEKSNSVNSKYSQDVGDLTNDFNEQFPTIGNGYASRGAYDSSYRINKEEGAKDAYGRSLGQLAQGRDSDLAGVGSWLQGQRANFDAEKGGLNSVLQQIGEETDVDRLTTLRNTIDEKLRSTQASRSQLGTQGGYLQTLNQVVPTSNRLSGLNEQLQNVIKSSVPGQIKKAIGSQLIANSGISGAEAAQQQELFGQLVDGDQNKIQQLA